MDHRLDAFAAAPDAINAMRKLEGYVANCGIEHSLYELVKIRASQINGCAFCIHMHTTDARAGGETDERMHLLSAWRESPLFTPRERAALAWTEALTRIADTHAPDADYEEARKHFTDEELVKLTLMIGSINVWNRIAIGFRKLHPVGDDAGLAAQA
ncbi:carboxymuconolactone decarboxylase family protein [Kaustia mangrovi]|uniref:Carboxymuconolactone decarboxylase family protein n=1 Tax=Kaustia mangrovi TaxID=2593653 RepID=A0A7S8HDH8_9HYPH|nr:carboxymuconolactone decarboxylase family protein [Kaustia mangrovi]QPC44670.1 carboxymuconolactone decarboxylase family protein [Kaustia mangrovi]